MAKVLRLYGGIGFRTSGTQNIIQAKYFVILFFKQKWKLHVLLQLIIVCYNDNKLRGMWSTGAFEQANMDEMNDIVDVSIMITL